MAIQVRVNRDHRRHLWTVQSLTHGTRLGRASGLLLRDVTFVRQGPSGWADGELCSWSEIQVDPEFGQRLEQRTCDYLDLTWVPVIFRDGEFFAEGHRAPALSGAGWLRIVGRGAWVALPTWAC